MTISTPVAVGSTYQRNRTSWTFTLTQPVPAGALIWLLCGGTVPDTATITVSDPAGNDYQIQVFSQSPGVTGAMLVLIVPNCKALTAGQVITINSSVRSDLLAQMYYFSGAQGSLYSTDVEWGTNSAPSATVPAKAGMAVFGVVAVAGPNNDGFTQPSGWGADLSPNISTVNATIHAGSQIVAADGTFTYNPTLSANRQTVTLAAAFL